LRRFQLFEILDQQWCPQAVRDGATDFLEHIANTTDLYSAVRGRILQCVRESGSHNVVDLCSGGGGPWLSDRWRAASRDPEWPLRVVLTDKFPSAALQSKLNCSGDTLRAVAESVDVTAVPAQLRGFRTIFASFHHFSDPVATTILEDAVRAGEGIATAEVTSRTVKAIVLIGCIPLLVLVQTPAIRPFRLSRIILTYLLPAIPLTILWDGLVSCLRTRTPNELRQLASGLEAYTWTSGYDGGSLFKLPVVYLTGVPRDRHAATKPV
jgi:hypothetical protein